MGDGKKLKEMIDSRGTNVLQVAKKCGIGQSTLYSIINKDSVLRYDYALRLANALECDVQELCSNVPFSGALKMDDIYPDLHDSTGFLDDWRTRYYVRTSMLPMLELFGPLYMHDVDNILTDFYQLDDEARHMVVELIQALTKTHKDPNRAEQIKDITHWRSSI